MNKNNKIWQVLGIIALACFFYFLGTYFTKKKVIYQDRIKVVKTLEKRIDTLYLERKVIEKEIVYKEKYRDKLKEELKKTVIPDTCKEIVRNYEQQLANCDSIVLLKDRIIVKTDSIVVFKDKIIDKLVIPKPKPFGIGLQVGYGIDGKPYVGAGISVNLIRF